MAKSKKTKKKAAKKSVLVKNLKAKAGKSGKMGMAAVRRRQI